MDPAAAAFAAEDAFLSRLRDQLRQFAAARDWERFHSPKNLAMALMVEAAELAELFQWLDCDESLTADAVRHQAAADEVADVLIYLVRLADQLAIDIPTAVADKMRRNARKYPPLDGMGAAAEQAG